MIATANVAQTLEDPATRLHAAGVPGARRDARLLLCHATGLALERVVGFPERSLSRGEAQRFEALLSRRMAREPISQIVGVREFWSLPFKVTADTLTPRPETETLVEAALAFVPDRARSLRILDLGTGTGCILLALLSELPNATGLGIDRSAPAIRVAEENARALGLIPRAKFAAADWNTGTEAQFDIVISNPPYIPNGSIETLDPEVALHEPWAALAGGVDGLACYRALAPVMKRSVAARGLVLLEVGAGQVDAVTGIFARSGFFPWDRRLDLAGIERCLIMSPRAMPTVMENGERHAEKR